MASCRSLVCSEAARALKGQADALYVVNDALVNANRTRIITLALGARLPTIFNTRDHVQAGGLMSYARNPEAPTFGLDAVPPISIEKFPRSLFYIFLRKKACRPSHNLSHLGACACGQIRNIAVYLLHRA